MKQLLLAAAMLLSCVSAAPERVYAQCEPVTSYIPVTTTVTVTQPSSSLSAIETQSTRFTTSTTTSTVHLSNVPSSVSPASAQTTYSFVVESGQTSWYGPTPSSGLSLTTITTTIYVLPSTTLLSLPTTVLAPITIEPPPYVSTSLSVVEPVSTSTITKTRTSTTVVTNVITLSRSAFTSPGTGWNSTAVNPASFSTSVSSVDGIPTTITGTVYWTMDSGTTTSSVTTLTLTLTRSQTQTLTTTLPRITSTVSVAAAETSNAGVASSTGAETSEQVTTLQSSGVTISSDSSSSSEPIAAASYGGESSSIVTVTASMSAVAATSSPTRAPFSSIATPSSFDSLSAGAGASSSSPLGPAPFESSTLLSQSLSQGSSASVAAGPTSSTALSSGITSASSQVISTSAATSISTTESLRSQGSTVQLSTTPYGVFKPSSIQSLSSPVSSTTAGYASSDSQSASSVVSSLSSLQTSVRYLSTASTPGSLTISLAASQQSSSSRQPSSLAVTSTGSPSGTFLASVLPITTGSLPASGTVSASPTPSVCGEHGNFTLNFDDLPSFMPNSTIDITQAPPVFNGYHHMAFSNGYVYAPPPKAPFPPVSQPHLAVFLGNASGNGSTNTPGAMAPISGFIRPGEFGNGVSDSVSAFWFNGYGAWLGCDNSGPEPCTYVVTAYAWNPTTLKEEQVDTQNLTTPACPGFENCRLAQVPFPSTFRGLSGLQIQAYKGPDQVMFFMDDVQLGWYNNTCAAGLQRLRSQRGGTPMRRWLTPLY